MPIPFTCPHCGFQAKVDERFADTTGPCGSCGKRVTIPPVGAGRSVPILVIVLIIVAVVSLLVVGLLVAWLLPATRESAGRAECTNQMRQIVYTRVSWNAPIDLDVKRMTFKINGGAGEIGSQHAGGVAMVAFANGHVQRVRESAEPETVRAMVTRSGGESYSLDD